MDYYGIGSNNSNNKNLWVYEYFLKNIEDFGLAQLFTAAGNPINNGCGESQYLVCNSL